MKRIISIILIVSICFLFAACKNVEKQKTSEIDILSSYEISSESQTSSNNKSFSNNSTSSKKEEKQTASSKDNTTVNSTPTNSNSDNSETEKTEPEESYENIECVSTAGYKEVRILPTGSKAHLILKLPQEWKIEKSSQGFSIIKNSKKIGTVSENFKLSGEIKYNEEYSFSGVTSEHIISKTGAKQYNHIISYTCEGSNGKNPTITFCLPYSELNSNSVYNMVYNVSMNSSTKKSNIGAMPLTDNRKKILILGNSFIASSQIGSILKQMCDSNIEIEAQARGYTEVSTYVQDTYLLGRIKSGEFSALFMCGFYGYDDVGSFETFVNACNSSNTGVAIFPAHNEGRQNIDSATRQFPNVLLLDWKNEIDELIANGVQASELYVNDMHGHSTPLAGYVGAHMIYRAVFGKVPAQKSFAEVPSYQINLLGDYVKTGLTDSSVKDEYVIYKF